MALAAIAALLVLAWAGNAGPAGEVIAATFRTLLGAGFLFLPLALTALALMLFLERHERLLGIAFWGIVAFFLSLLGGIELLAPHNGGILGKLLGDSLRAPFGTTGALLILAAISLISLLTALNTPLRLAPLLKAAGRGITRLLAVPRRRRLEEAEQDGEEEEESEEEDDDEEEDEEDNEEENAEEEEEESDEGEEEEAAQSSPKPQRRGGAKGGKGALLSLLFSKKNLANYTFPPLSLLAAASERPTTGDLRANANVIKRTLESFGIQVAMGEINVGPKVTRYTLKPAEGIKLSRIEALHKDLALALAAHPIRIEAPIPGKSLVGIEVPNRSAALVRLGSLLGYPEFQKAGPLSLALGRDVAGNPLFPDISTMPHLLIAGSTGSGKSVVIHSLLTALLYRHTPQTLRLILVDPKRVELSLYSGIPHLAAPVVTESKKALNVFRWAIQEMERRYDILLESGSQNITSYLAKKQGALPYVVIIVDELADLMTSHGKEVEGAIVRLAQMARATGIHLILSTQRPSVEILTGLIKANIPARIALQVASQIDSRTILDMSGAEKLLGGGDLLYLSPKTSKPVRVQGSFISEKEVRKVVSFIKEHNADYFSSEEGEEEDEAREGQEALSGATREISFDALGREEGEEEDDLYGAAVRVVAQAKKASASLLQRRLRIGYARAARLLDIMEEHHIIGPGEGAKPREVFLENIPDHLLE